MNDAAAVPELSDHCGDGLPGFRRYRIYALSTGAADVIESIAGFLVDATWAGWETTVLADGFIDSEKCALRVLGARSGELESAFAALSTGLVPDVLAISSGLYDVDRRVQDWVRSMRRRTDVSVIIWGVDVRSGIAKSKLAVHESSAAAVAFKSCALALLGKSQQALPAAESFRVDAAGRVAELRLWTGLGPSQCASSPTFESPGIPS